MQPEALVFDFDGTLVDSMPMHFRCWQRTLSTVGLTFDHATFHAWGGVTTREIVRRLSDAQGVDVDVEAIIEAKEACTRAHAHEAVPIEPVMAIARAHRGRLPMAIATGGPRAVVGPRLDALGIREWFDAIVTADDVEQGKPHPEPFLRAAELLGVDPTRCRAYEDAPAGIEAARAAGMDVVDVATLIDRADAPQP
ncbi:MAG: HAD family hydrolase [Nannocystaceae bacterium]|nr:HAD-IA family hydrolase [bacterium]